MSDVIWMQSVGDQSFKMPPISDLAGVNQYRIIPSTYPTINFFENIVDAHEMELLWEIESLTNDRLRQEAGDIYLVAREDRVGGPGSSVVMAAFTHVSKPTRFSNGTFGVYYAGLSQETAIRETVYHRERFLKATKEPPLELCMRQYRGRIKMPMHDIRSAPFEYLHDPVSYDDSQAFGESLRANASWGVVYHSVRHHSGTCVALFRPPATSIPKEVSHLRYVWDGNRMTEVIHVHAVLKLT